MTIPLLLLFAIICAAWRFLDGMDHQDSGLPTWARNLGTIALALAAAVYARGFGVEPVWMASCAGISIIVGETNWQSPTWQAIRFACPAALAVMPLDAWQGWPYVAACALGGLAYPALFAIHARWPLPRLWRLRRMGDDGQPHFAFSGPEAYARLPLGAAIIGGLALVG